MLEVVLQQLGVSELVFSSAAFGGGAAHFCAGNHASYTTKWPESAVKCS